METKHEFWVLQKMCAPPHPDLCPQRAKLKPELSHSPFGAFLLTPPPRRSGASVVSDETTSTNSLTMNNAQLHFDEIGSQLLPMQAPSMSGALNDPPKVNVRGGSGRGKASGGSSAGGSKTTGKDKKTPAPTPAVPEHLKKKESFLKEITTAITGTTAACTEPSTLTWRGHVRPCGFC